MCFTWPEISRATGGVKLLTTFLSGPEAARGREGVDDVGVVL